MPPTPQVPPMEGMTPLGLTPKKETPPHIATNDDGDPDVPAILKEYEIVSTDHEVQGFRSNLTLRHRATGQRIVAVACFDSLDGWDTVIRDDHSQTIGDSQFSDVGIAFDEARQAYEKRDQNADALIDAFREVAPRQTTSRHVEIERLTLAPGDHGPEGTILVITEWESKQTVNVATLYQAKDGTVTVLSPEQFTDLCSVMRDYIPERPET